jgi:hypothetical protein
MVRGLDLAPIQPTYVPLNCSFYVADIAFDLDETLFPTGSIDFVHMRHSTLLYASDGIDQCSQE